MVLLLYQIREDTRAREHCRVISRAVSKNAWRDPSSRIIDVLARSRVASRRSARVRS